MNDTWPLTGPAPGFEKNPDHHVRVEPVAGRIRVMLGGETVASSTDALVQFETNHKPVYYFPRADARLDLMERTDHDTF